MGKLRRIKQFFNGVLDAAGVGLGDSAYVPLNPSRDPRHAIPHFSTYGRWTIPPRWACYAALCVGALILAIGAAVIYLGAVSRSWTGTLVGIGLLLYGAVILVGDIRLLGMRDRIAQMKPAADVQAQMGLNESGFRDLAAGKAIKPKYVVNEVELYDPDDFRGAMTLLRPTASDPSLVRPATTQGELADLLVRPAESGGE